MSDNETLEYEYRIVLESSSGTKLPLLSQDNDLHTTQQRLMDILINTDYAKGWIERRPLGAWEMFPPQEQRNQQKKQTTVQHTRGCITGDIDSECPCERESL